MDFGLFYYCQGRGVPHDQAYAEMLDQIALAETLGFGECWFAEHHFTDYSLLPSPNLMIAAALAGRFWRFPDLSPRPRAFQRPPPLLHRVASRPASAARVGARGWPVAMHFTPTDVVARCVEEYRAAVAARTEAAGEGPYRPRLLLCRETYVAETAATARAEGALALQGFWYLSSLAAPPLPSEFSDARLTELTGRVWGGRTYGELAAMGDRKAARMIAIAPRAEQCGQRHRYATDYAGGNQSLGHEAD